MTEIPPALADAVNAWKEETLHFRNGSDPMRIYETALTVSRLCTACSLAIEALGLPPNEQVRLSDDTDDALAYEVKAAVLIFNIFTDEEWAHACP